MTGRERSRQSEVCSFREVKCWRCWPWQVVGRIPISFERFRATATDLAKCSRNSTRRSHSERPAGKVRGCLLSPKSIKYLAVLAFLATPSPPRRSSRSNIVQPWKTDAATCRGHKLENGPRLRVRSTVRNNVFHDVYARPIINYFPIHRFHAIVPDDTFKYRYPHHYRSA